MKKSLVLAASLLALGVAAPAIAHVRHDCADESCSTELLFGTQNEAGGPGSGVQAVRYGAWGLDIAGMDRSVKPGEDFNAYVNGNWTKTNTIPADRSSFGAFAVLRDLSEARLCGLVEGYRAEAGGDAAKVALLYQGFMDEAAVERQDAIPLLTRLAPVYQAKTKDDIARLMGRSIGGFGGSFFGPGVSDDAKQPDIYSLYLRQSGLGLGDRDLYLDAKFKPQRDRYVVYVEQMLEMAGWPAPAASAREIMALETRIAEAHWTRAESRNRDKTYNLMTLADLQTQAPGFPWATFLDAAGVGVAERAIVAQNSAFPKLAKIFADADLQTLKAWEVFHTADDAAPLLSKRFVDANFEFRSKFLNGQPQQRDRWKRGVAIAENAMGEAIGRDYVARYFPPESKAKMDALVVNLRTALRGRLAGLDWMSAATKQEAQKKLESFNVKIGYPDTWRDYSALTVVPGDLVGNVERASRFEWDYRRNRIAQRVDEAEWGMTPQTVNAYYNSVKNEIVFPAAILQPPFFDPDADPAINYGGIGGVIGHEIIHGFDDQGRKSDGNGVLRDWWTAEDAAKFEAQAAKFGAQYEAYTFPNLPGVHINGRASMGENIGDLGGITLGLEAYRASLGGQPAPVLDGFTGDQRVFLGWGQVWRTLFRDEALRQQLVSDPHSPGMIRAFAPLRNVDAWYEAFNVQPGDKLYIAPADRVRIW
ncbi:M13 family metallopeptidase [Sphingosinicella sp. BN140058]|uniref:M13 family metallopeptidase n=1 Tax=Sphingosinicella sp. BN140058 TaxID=1892855 RepID=UPI001011F5C9|nr:M13-type metalloendopeptidase [Sphingosinicella sp. BN140058]QAY75244.1 peptidase M13 [Sphingosinicella sp. BN140058]